MEYKNNRVNGVFSHENFVNAIRLWERAAISLVDIRHNLISPESAIRGYRMPTSTFVYTSGGKAEVSLDDTSYRIERFGLFHGGKGTELSITPTDGWLEYYMVLYKAGEPPFHKKEFIKQIERSNPFRNQYGFQPNNPIFFAEQLCKMYERWKDPASLHLLYGKTSFYQLVYEIYEELESGSVHILQPDIAAQAIRFIDNNYGHSITIQSIIEAMKISPTHLNRLIKQRTGKSPQDYLMHVRFKAVCRQLINGDYTLKEIANATGGIVYKELGLNAPETVQTNIIDKDTYSEMVSFEVLSEYSGDYIIRNTYEDMEDLSQDDIWKAIPAVKNNRVIGMEFGLSYYSDIYSATAQINYVTEALLEAAAQ